jgi:hypothetical protein
MAGTLEVQTIQGPSSGANANKVIIPSGHTLDASGGTLVPSAGAVVQVVEATSSTPNSFNTTSGWLSLTASITPKSSTSLILVKVHLDGITRTDDDASSYGKLLVYRNRGAANETYLRPFGYPMGWSSVDNASGTTAYAQMIDSPSTTSSTSYDLYWQHIAGTFSVQEFNRDGSPNCVSSIVLMEIAG